MIFIIIFLQKGRRLQRDIKRSVDTRLRISENLSEGRIKVFQINFLSNLANVLNVRYFSQRQSIFK